MTRCSYETALLSAVPGALSQMIVMAEENKRADLLAVTLSQTSRLLFVVMIVPFIASFGRGGNTGGVMHSDAIFRVLSFDRLLFIISLTGLFFLLLRRIHFPVPQLLAPIFIVSRMEYSDRGQFFHPLCLDCSRSAVIWGPHRPAAGGVIQQSVAETLFRYRCPEHPADLSDLHRCCNDDGSSL